MVRLLSLGRFSLSSFIDQHSLDKERIKLKSWKDNVTLLKKISWYMGKEWHDARFDLMLSSFEFTTSEEGEQLALLAQKWRNSTKLHAM